MAPMTPSPELAQCLLSMRDTQVKELNMTALQGWILIGLLMLIMLGIVGIGVEIKDLPYLWRTHDVGSLNPGNHSLC